MKFKIKYNRGGGLGLRLYDELKYSKSDIEVKCFIDRNIGVCETDVPVYDMNDLLP